MPKRTSGISVRAFHANAKIMDDKVIAIPHDFISSLIKLCKLHRVEIDELDFWVCQTRKYRLIHQSPLDGSIELAEMMRVSRMDWEMKKRRLTARNYSKRTIKITK